MLGSIKSRLLILIFLCLGIVVLLVSILVFQFYTNELKERSKLYFVEKVEHIKEQTDSIIYRMDTVSTQLLANDTLQELFVEASMSEEDNQNYFEYHIEDRKLAQGILWAFDSPKSQINGINIFDENSYVGLSNSPKSEEIRQIAREERWEIDDSHVYKLIKPHIDEWDTMNNRKVISLVRTFIATNYGFSDVGTIEVNEDFSLFENIFLSSTQEEGLKLLVMNQEGEVIYDNSDWTHNQEKNIYDQSRVDDEKKLINIMIDKASYQMTYVDLNDAGWTFILMQPTKNYFEPVRSIMYQLILWVIMMCLVLYVLITLVVNRVLHPLKDLVEEIDTYSMGATIKERPCGIGEIDLLRQTFIRLTVRIEDSTRQLLMAKETELNLRILSLQGKINPHFLYNALNAISAMASEEGSEKAPIMCCQLSELFRYTSGEDQIQVSLKSEIENIKRYLAFMKWRYEDLFSYDTKLEGDLEAIPLPRLVLQPFVENIFTHGIKGVYPPYKVCVTCHQMDDGWFFSMIDNGSGFSDTSLRNLKDHMAYIDQVLDEQRDYKTLTTKDQAIINVYIRLRLLYKSRLSFDLGNQKDAGAYVKIKVEPIDKDGVQKEA